MLEAAGGRQDDAARISARLPGPGEVTVAESGVPCGGLVL
jgi:hypothetical protein